MGKLFSQVNVFPSEVELVQIATIHNIIPFIYKQSAFIRSRAMIYQYRKYSAIQDS